jgi:DNA-binding transcriptional ArsR family regulator
MKKKIVSKELEGKVLEILGRESRGMSIKEIKEKLEKDYKIKISPQVVLRHLLSLKEKGKILES